MTAASMVSLTASIAAALLSVALILTALRAFAGPTAADRIVALDVVSFLAVGLVALVAFETGTYALLDAAAIPALIGFVATAAVARFIDDRGDDDR
jgi:multicomponent Na+:H+ antiporter subunit F